MYDKEGKATNLPRKVTFDISGKKDEGLKYFIPQSYIVKDKGPEVTIKIALSDENAKEWFDSIKTVAKMGSIESKSNDENLEFSKKVVENDPFQSGSVGIITIEANQNPLSRNRITKFRITDAKGVSEIFKTDIKEDMKPILELNSTIASKTGEDIKFNIEHIYARPGDKPIKKVTLTYPDGSQKELKDIKEYTLINILFGIDGKVLNKAGRYKVDIEFEGFKDASKSF